MLRYFSGAAAVTYIRALIGPCLSRVAVALQLFPSVTSSSIPLVSPALAVRERGEEGKGGEEKE